MENSDISDTSTAKGFVSQIAEISLHFMFDHRRHGNDDLRNGADTTEKVTRTRQNRSVADVRSMFKYLTTWHFSIGSKAEFAHCHGQSPAGEL